MKRREKKKAITELWHQYRWTTVQYGAHSRTGNHNHAKALLPALEELKSLIDKLQGELDASGFWKWR